jgi:hypothetical protein
MPQVKLKVLQTAAEQITAKLHKDSLDAKIHEDTSKDKQKIELLSAFKLHVEDLTSGEILCEKQNKKLVDKINVVLDKFSDLVGNKDLKRQINDAFKKRTKSKNEKKPTLKLHTVQRLHTIFAAKGLEGSFDSLLNQLLTLLGVPEYSLQKDESSAAKSSLESQSSRTHEAKVEIYSVEYAAVHDQILSEKDQIKQLKKAKKDARKMKKKQKHLS